MRPFNLDRYKDFIKQPFDPVAISLPALTGEIILRGIRASIPGEMALRADGIINEEKLGKLRTAFVEFPFEPLTNWLKESNRKPSSIIQGIRIIRGIE